MQTFWKNFWKEEEGQDLVEYALLLVLIALLSTLFITNIGTAVSKVYSNGASTMTSAAS